MWGEGKVAIAKVSGGGGEEKDVFDMVGLILSV